MNVLIFAVVWVSALVTCATAYAMLHDALLRPRTNTPSAWLRHVGRLFGLVTIAAASGTTLIGLRDVSQYTVVDVAVRVALALFMVGQSPVPWWRYVLFGRDPSDRRRPA